MMFNKSELALARLGAAQALLKKTESGVQFKGGLDRFEVFSASVAETQSWPPHWTQQEITNCMRRAIIETVKSGDLGWEAFCSALNASSETLFSAQLKEYAMWTKVNITTSSEFRAVTLRLDEVTLQIAPSPPKNLRFDEIEAPVTGRVRSDFPKGGMAITARGRFRSDLQAGEELFNRISDVCGFINLAEHRHRRTYRFGEAKPKATLLTGKYHFLFREGQHSRKRTLV